MVKRWFIRCIFILPILLCLGGWGWSVGHCVQVRYARHNYYVNCGTYFGTVFIHGGRQMGLPDFWEFNVIPQEPVRVLYPYNPNIHFFAGFGLEHEAGSWGHVEVLTVPYWFLIPLFGFILFFVWRKTGKKKLGGAFPVEVKASREA